MIKVHSVSKWIYGYLKIYTTHIPDALWLISAALKNPLCADNTVACALNCVIVGPTFNATSGVLGVIGLPPPPTLVVDKLSGAEDADGDGGGGGIQGPNDSHARYNEYMILNDEGWWYVCCGHNRRSLRTDWYLYQKSVLYSPL